MITHGGDTILVDETVSAEHSANESRGMLPPVEEVGAGHVAPVMIALAGPPVLEDVEHVIPAFPIDSAVGIEGHANAFGNDEMITRPGRVAHDSLPQGTGRLFILDLLVVGLVVDLAKDGQSTEGCWRESKVHGVPRRRSQQLGQGVRGDGTDSMVVRPVSHAKSALTRTDLGGSAWLSCIQRKADHQEETRTRSLLGFPSLGFPHQVIEILRRR